MGKVVPAQVQEQRINALPNIEFVRWAAEFNGARSKAICRCRVDGFEWASRVDSLIGSGHGCPKCARQHVGRRRIPPEKRSAQIDALPNIEFIRWVDGYKNKKSKAICRCTLDNFEWATSVDMLVNYGAGCPLCLGRPRWSAEERIAQINAVPNIEFVRWVGGEYITTQSKAVFRCLIDGFEWAAGTGHVVAGRTGCPQCSSKRKWFAEERIAQINALPNISFVRWADEYKNSYSKVVCRCAIDGTEWAPTVSSLVHGKRGCPQCSKTGYDPAKPGTLYVLRSECGSMVKIGISNDYKQRLAGLRYKTPFKWACIELLHGDGATIAEWEKEFHSWTEQVEFKEPFDGSTEWRKWDDRLPMWVKRHRARLERYNSTR